MIIKYQRLAILVGAGLAAAVLGGCASDGPMRGQGTMGATAMESSSSSTKTMGAGMAGGSMHGAVSGSGSAAR